jgi:F0F1-type ATP synthase membrane subunit b/b'
MLRKTILQKRMPRKIISSKTFVVGLLALFALGVPVGTRLLQAQEQEQPASQPKQKRAEDSGKQPGLAQQLARETKEAAGEEEKDDKAVFKLSPSVRFIAQKFGISTEAASGIAFLFNFAVIAGILIWASRKYLPGAFSSRTAAIQKAMQDAQKASEEARKRLAEIENRLQKLDVEIGMMRDAAEKEATEEEARIQAVAQEDARKMVESAQQEIASAAKAARRELTAYAADLAVGLAKQQIHVDAGTDEVLVRNFAADLGAYSDTAGTGKDGR